VPPVSDPRVVVGYDTADDAGVVRLVDGRYLIQTLDFFTPIVDDPFTFGAIAATNALSDVYAMGGVPLSALNIVCWPEKDLPEEVLIEILRGGAAKIREAGAVLVGGHSVTDKELKYGLSISGFTDKDRLWTNAGAQVGDRLVLTKAVGTGIITTAMKREQCPTGAQDAAVESMLKLNAEGRSAALELDVHACTDITGNGLVGHSWEMARASNVQLVVQADSVPVLQDAIDLAAAGHLTRGEKSNRAYVGDSLSWGDVPAALQSVIVDPQTSGGLLFALGADNARVLIDSGVGTDIGEVVDGSAGIRIE